MCESAAYASASQGGSLGEAIDSFEVQGRFPENCNYGFPLLGINLNNMSV